MDIHQCDFLYRLRCLGRQPLQQWFAGDRCAHGECNLYAYLHRYRRQRDAVRDRLGYLPSPKSEFDGEPHHGHQRHQFHTGLVSNQCNLLYRLRCLVGQRGNERVAVQRRPDSERDLYPELQRQRQQRVAIGVGDGDRAGTGGYFHRQSQHGHQRRYVDVDLVVNQCDFLHCLGRMERQ